MLSTLFNQRNPWPGEDFAASPTLLPPPRDPLISGLGARDATPDTAAIVAAFSSSEGGRKRNGAPLFNFHAFFYNLPFPSPALSLGQHQNVCAAAASPSLHSNAEAEVKALGPIHIFTGTGRNIAIRRLVWKMQARQDRPSSVGHLTC